ncbi:MAG: GMC family oxidoreductase N-terminal domain-containing protein [Anaerolineae bacterium]
MATEKYDYIIVGAGASGCVIANRLSANPALKVLILEAGATDTDPGIHALGGFVPLWGGDYDWKFATETQKGMGGRQIIINQGRVIGGGTSINAMMYVRGNRRNYDQWNALGADGWSFDDVLPYYKRIEDYEGGASEYHGVGGPLKIRDCPDPAMRSEAFQVGATELGYDGPNWDNNGARQEDGAGFLQFHVDDQGNRASAATAYLAPAMKRPNLTVQTEAEVTRVLFSGTRANGVEYVHQGQTLQVEAEREVILSAGAFLSPKLLLLSGIGPADHLRELGLKVLVDLPGVGQNLQDHVQLPVVFRSLVNLPQPDLLTGNVLFVRTRPGMDAAPPDLQMNYTPAVPKALAPVMNFGGPASIFLPILIQPYSIGEVRLRSADPLAAPSINPNYLQQDADVQVLVAAVKLAREIINTKAFAGLNGGELVPGPDADLVAFIRAQSSTLWHPAGTCKIGYDARAVVDSALRVYGVQGLRVADASVMPTVTSGNTVAACFLIGEKAADMILNA